MLIAMPRGLHAAINMAVPVAVVPFARRCVRAMRLGFGLGAVWAVGIIAVVIIALALGRLFFALFAFV